MSGAFERQSWAPRAKRTMLLKAKFVAVLVSGQELDAKGNAA
jgi:hypothetical protein